MKYFSTQSWRPIITKTCLFKYSENFTTKKFSDKKLWYFSYFCSKHRLWISLEPPRWGGSNEYPQSMFLSRNKKNNVYPSKPQFYYIKVGFKGGQNYIGMKKNEIFQIKNSDIFHISAQNIDCGYSLEPPRRGRSNVYPQSMFLSRNKKNNVYPCKPQFYYIKVGFKGVKII